MISETNVLRSVSAGQPKKKRIQRRRWTVFTRLTTGRELNTEGLQNDGGEVERPADICKQETISPHCCQ